MTTERILVVDDEEPIREIISSMLSAAGYKTRLASSGMEALAILKSSGEFDLMLSDLMMAELDGIALLERSKEKYPDMHVIMVTAVHDISVALAAIRNGAYDYLLKPFEREQLLAMVRRALETRRLKLENRAYQHNLESMVTAKTEQLRQAMTDLERSYDITLEALGDALDLKDSETEGHSKRVTAFTIAIARAMGISTERVRIIARGAFLHDIGKMAIPDSILRKPGALTPEEISIMREHCFRGYQMLRKIPFLGEAAEIVYSHQERYDGTGYPRNLKGHEIPLGARIFSVADTLDAMTSDRPYRAAQTIAAAREEIHRFSGRQFDPEVVKIFLQMPDSIWEDLRKEINSQAARVGYPNKPTQTYATTNK
ncbi:MAG TPA: HD domain-containing phosphohydrolase [Candidatus Angelobacter sp.]|jgi:putative nucleotidyltransferase with HDIG domain|nr:HD domain-containing phosphohydrolase [Candidatus Angelobacter sp.]